MEPGWRTVLSSTLALRSITPSSSAFPPPTAIMAAVFARFRNKPLDEIKAAWARLLKLAQAALISSREGFVSELKTAAMWLLEVGTRRHWAVMDGLRH